MYIVSKKYNIDTICITRGDRGAIVFSKGNIYQHSGFEVNVIDTYVAGYAFLAAFLAAYLHGNYMNEILNYACAFSAYCVTQPGVNLKYNTNDIINTIHKYMVPK